MKKKNYFEPTMKLHELKMGHVLDTISRADTKTGDVPEKQNLEDFTEVEAW